MQRFFDVVRNQLFSGRLKQEQVDGLNVILDVTADLSVPFRAYILATAFHETDSTMEPLEESEKGKHYSYGKWRTNSKGVKYCYTNGKKNKVYTEQEYPHLYYGRGFVQLTWLDNYRRATAELRSRLPEQVDLVANPECACRSDIAAQVLVLGMMQGWFTGKKLSDYLSGGCPDYVNARRIVNGRDKAELIASYARVFEMALLEMGRV